MASHRRRVLLAVLVLALLAAATIVARGATPAAADPGSVDPSCGQTDPAAKVVAYTYVLDTALATARSGVSPAPRCPNNAEGAYWTAFLAAGHPRSSFAYPMNQTFVAPFWIEIAYHSALGRDPDARGRAYWTNVARSTGKVMTVYNGLLGSEERLSAAASVSDYVAQLYQFYVGEAPDPAGLTYWTNYLTGGGSRQALTYALSQRPEVAAAMVTYAYGLTLGRPADAGSVPYWSNVYRFVQGNELMVMALLTNSQEYYQNCQSGTLPPVGLSGSRGAAALGNGLRALASS
jgi:hypothetical protein